MSGEYDLRTGKELDGSYGVAKDIKDDGGFEAAATQSSVCYLWHCSVG